MLLRSCHKHLNAQFPQGLHHEIPFAHMWMWDDKVGLADVYVVIQQQIYVDDPVAVSSVRAFLCSSHHVFYLPCCIQALARREWRMHLYGGIQECVFAFKPPWLRHITGRYSGYPTHSLPDESYSPLKVLLPVAHVGSEAHEYDVERLSHSE